MNWITNFVRPKLSTLLNRRESPDNLWQACSSCSEMIFHRDLSDSLYVCPHCRHHMQISPTARLAALFDHSSYETVPIPAIEADPLKFKDQKRYTDRLRDARHQTESEDAMLVGYGQIGKRPAVIAVQNFSFMAGSMGMAVGEAILAAAQRAIQENAPLILFSAAGGARMQEGILSLMQMPRTTIAIQMLREANLPYICVLTHPTTGGVTASYAMLGDIQISEPNALICFAGPRVIEQTIREKLPEGFQRAEYLLEHGMLDMVVDRRDMRKELARLIRLLRNDPPLIAGHLEDHTETMQSIVPTETEITASAETDESTNHSAPATDLSKSENDSDNTDSVATDTVIPEVTSATTEDNATEAEPVLNKASTPDTLKESKS